MEVLGSGRHGHGMVGEGAMVARDGRYGVEMGREAGEKVLER